MSSLEENEVKQGENFPVYTVIQRTLFSIDENKYAIEKNGDYVLKTVAELMKQSFRKTDLLYRYGGEELVMIMPETNIEGAVIPVQRLRRMVEEYDFEYNGVKAKVTVSIGLTMNYQNLNTLL